MEHDSIMEGIVDRRATAHSRNIHHEHHEHPSRHAHHDHHSHHGSSEVEGGCEKVIIMSYKWAVALICIVILFIIIYWWYTHHRKLVAREECKMYKWLKHLDAY